MLNMPCRVSGDNLFLALFTKIHLQFVSPLERGSQAFDPCTPGGMLAFALWRRLLPHEMLVRINRTTRGQPSVYKRVIPNGGH